MSRNNRYKNGAISTARRPDYKPAFPNIATKEESDKMSLKPVIFRGIRYPNHFHLYVQEHSPLKLGQIIGDSQLDATYALIWGGRRTGIIQVSILGNRYIEFDESERQAEKDEYPYVVLSILLRTIIEETKQKE